MDLLREFKVTNMDKTIMYSEWQKISQEITRSTKACSERNTKVTKKVTVQEKVSILFIYLFIYLKLTMIKKILYTKMHIK